MPKHLIVLSHGWFGNAGHLDNLVKDLQANIKDAYILNITNYPGSFTFDGADVCGEKAVAEILKHSEDILTVSFIGYSQGGLILRYAIGKLYNLGFFKRVEPLYFITYATPHCGTIGKPKTFGAYVFVGLQNMFLYRSGRQFGLTDSFLDKRPLLEVMADPQHCFYKGLALFKRRIALANIQKDRSVSWETAFISHTNPFKEYEAKPLDGYPSIVTASDTKIQPKKKTLSFYLNWALFFALLPVLFPLWLVLATSILGYQSIKSRLRFLNRGAVVPVLEETSTKEIEGDAFGSVDLMLPDLEPRHYIIEQLNKLTWTKISVCLDAFNAHAAIVRRNRKDDLFADINAYVIKEIVNDFE
ncbi:putative serine esterase-domain-containing protein [Gorgonomyces haynaldii]|nr:putative serine esterase-domain-containing protein [Gorgonomyces haynaldii]